MPPLTCGSPIAAIAFALRRARIHLFIGTAAVGPRFKIGEAKFPIRVMSTMDLSMQSATHHFLVNPVNDARLTHVLVGRLRFARPTLEPDASTTDIAAAVSALDAAATPIKQRSTKIGVVHG